jgi:hypothetical protein
MTTDWSETCNCVTDCAEDPDGACSLSGEPHVHPEFGRLPSAPRRAR